MPPAEDPPETPPTEGAVEGEDDNGGFTLMDAPPGDAPYVGDMNEAPPVGGGDDMGVNMDMNMDMGMGFAGGEDIGFAAAPPSEDAPIILAGAAPPTLEEPDMDGMGVVTVEDAEPEDPAEPSPMQKWNADWQETLLVRKDGENTTKGEAVEAAQSSMENFNKEREQKRETKMAMNREDEQAKLEAIEADLENDNSWQRVCKMVELSHDGADDSEDTKRMRDVMILLKNEPSRAATVGA
jgi:hypothetical protein